MKVARHEEGNSEIQEHPSFLTHSFKVMPSFHKALNRCKARETAGSSWVGGRRLCSGSESSLSVIYLVFNNFRPRSYCFCQSFVDENHNWAMSTRGEKQDKTMGKT